MICPNCNKEIENNNFCPNCGFQFVNTDEAISDNFTNNPPISNPIKSNKIIISVVFTVVIVIVIALICNLSSGSKEEKLIIGSWVSSGSYYNNNYDFMDGECTLDIKKGTASYNNFGKETFDFTWTYDSVDGVTYEYIFTSKSNGKSFHFVYRTDTDNIFMFVGDDALVFERAK